MADPFAELDNLGDSDPFSELDNIGGDSYADLDNAQPKPKLGTGAGALGDVIIGVGKGALQTPGIVTGALDIIPGLAGIDRPFGRATDYIGEATGFQPGKVAEQTKFSPKLEAQMQQESQVWDDPTTGALDVAKFYAQNPAVAAGKIAESAAPMALGGVASRFVPALGAAGRAAAGEGAVIAGSLSKSAGV